MPLGDSITLGTGSTGQVGYRLKLLDDLQDKLVSVDYVGSQDSGSGLISDTDHEGRSGWRIDQIDQIADCNVRRYRPNVVTLHAGTNDMSQDYNVGSAPDRLAGLIRKITSAVPEALVLVSSIVPSTDSVINARISSYNLRLASTVGTLAAEGRRVRYVGMGAVTTADLRDWLHPNTNGYNKMADAWRAAIFTALFDGAVARPVAGDSGACSGPAPGNGRARAQARRRPAPAGRRSARSPQVSDTPATRSRSPT